MSDNLKDLLAFDAFAEAEKHTDKSYKEDDGTSALGMLLQFQKVAAVRRVLTERDDTHMSVSFADARRIVESEGFHRVSWETFTSKRWNQIDHFLIYFHPSDGILLKLESWRDGVNTMDMAFNWTHPEAEWPERVSGGWHKRDKHGPDEASNYVFVGHMDVREAFRLRLNELRASGTFVTPWLERPFLWLLTYDDTRRCTHESSVHGDCDHPGPRCYDSEVITEGRIAKLPESVRAAITPASQEAKAA